MLCNQELSEEVKKKIIEKIMVNGMSQNEISDMLNLPLDMVSSFVKSFKNSQK